MLPDCLFALRLALRKALIWALWSSAAGWLIFIKDSIKKSIDLGSLELGCWVAYFDQGFRQRKYAFLLFRYDFQAIGPIGRFVYLTSLFTLPPPGEVGRVIGASAPRCRGAGKVKLKVAQLSASRQRSRERLSASRQRFT